MSLWRIDLTTRAGARSAAHTAGTAAYAYAAAIFLGAMMFGTYLQVVGPYGKTALNLVPIGQVLLALFAGARLQGGKGLVIGLLLAVVVALDLLQHIVAFSGLAGLVLCAVVLGVLVLGLRGAYALHKGQSFEDDDIAAFD